MHKIILRIPFNDSNYLNGKNLTKEWIEYRLRISMKYTIDSLKKQTNQDFIAIFRFVAETEDIIKEALSKYESLPANIRFIKHTETEDFINQEITNGDYDYLFLVRLDSDDLYHKDYIEKLHRYQPKEGTQFLINQKGFIYDDETKRLAHWEQASPPFFVWVYPVQDYLAGIRYYTPGGHVSVIQFPHEVLDENNFMVVHHNQNTVTKFDESPFLTGHIKDQNVISKIMNEFM